MKVEAASNQIEESRSPKPKAAFEQFRQNRRAASVASLQVGYLAVASASLPVCADVFRICRGSG